MRSEDDKLLDALAGVAVRDIQPGPRTCGARVGECRSELHVHPSPYSQMSTEDWYLYVEQEDL